MLRLGGVGEDGATIPLPAALSGKERRHEDSATKEPVAGDLRFVPSDGSRSALGRLRFEYSELVDTIALCPQCIALSLDFADGTKT